MKQSRDINWDSYWKSIQLPVNIDLNFSFERCLAKAFSKILFVNPDLTLFDVGCAPGKWLIYFHKKFGYRVSGIDNSEVGCQKTLNNFEKQQIKGKIYQADFLSFTPPEKYDIVTSFGVIEHFDHPYQVLKRHLDFLKPGGKIILGIPNFKGVNCLIQKIVDKSLLKEWNLKIMMPCFYYEMAREFGLACLSVKYLGGFEPDLFFCSSKKAKINIVLRGILKITRVMRRIRWFDRFNAPLFSSYLLGVLYKKR